MEDPVERIMREQVRKNKPEPDVDAAFAELISSMEELRDGFVVNVDPRNSTLVETFLIGTAEHDEGSNCEHPSLVFTDPNGDDTNVIFLSPAQMGNVAMTMLAFILPDEVFADVDQALTKHGYVDERKSEND